MSNYGDTPDETPQDPSGQQPPPGPPGEPNYGPPPGNPDGRPYGEPAAQSPYDQTPYGQPAGANAPFSVGDAFGYGFNKFKANLGPILIVALVMFAVLATIQILQVLITGGEPALVASAVFGILSFLVQLVIQSGIVKGALDLTHGRPVSLASMFEGIDWVQVAVASLIIAVATTIGIALCVLPGLAVMFLTAFTLYFIIDKKLPAVEAIKASVSFTMANVGTLIVFFLACVAAYVVGALLCGVGLLVAIPVVVIAQAYTYRTLHHEQVAA